MLEGDHTKAEAVAKWFADFSRFKSHGTPVSVFDAQQQGLSKSSSPHGGRPDAYKTSSCRFITTHRHTFNDTGTTTLFENRFGRAYLEITLVVMQPPQPGPQQTARSAAGFEPGSTPQAAAPEQEEGPPLTAYRLPQRRVSGARFR